MHGLLQKTALVLSGIAIGSGLTMGYQKINKSLQKIEQRQESGSPSKLQTPINIKGEPALGRADAPITIVVFSDYECPYCRKFHDEVLPGLKKEYIEKGIVRLIHKDLPLPFHAQAELAARAARCSESNETYWKIHSQLFSKQECLACLGPTQIALTSKARGKDTLQNCMKSKRVSLAIASNISEAHLNNIRGTPTFIIGPSHPEKSVGEVLEGALPWEDFRNKIENALLKVKSKDQMHDIN